MDGYDVSKHVGGNYPPIIATEPTTRVLSQEVVHDSFIRDYLFHWNRVALRPGHIARHAESGIPFVEGDGRFFGEPRARARA